jgi:2-keto-4-pentenoate hydratase
MPKRIAMNAHETAARDLASRRRDGRLGPPLPLDARPVDAEAAFALQCRVVELIGDPIGGWKCALPTAGRVIVAPLFAASIRTTSPCALRVRGNTAPIEPEIAFVLGSDFPPRAAPYAEDEVRAAIAETRLVLEFLGNRYAAPAEVTPFEMLADCANNQGLFKGPPVAEGPSQRLSDIALAVAGPHGVIATFDGRHPDGDPVRPLVWLVNFLGRHGATLQRGQIVTTGSYAGAIDVPLDVPLTITFGALGSIDVHLLAAS